MTRRDEAAKPGERDPRAAGLATYVMTAGLASDDYRFLGRAPREAFWRRYAEFSSFERPTAILLSKNDSFRAYLSGIASARRDRTKTPLRYTLVLEGPCRSIGAVQALQALAAFVEDLADPEPSSLKVKSFGRALDAALPEPFVESALAALRDGPTSGAPPSKDAFAKAPAKTPLDEVSERALRAIESLPLPGDFIHSDVRFSFGGRGSAAARSQFLGYAERLLCDGEAGAALAVNLASRDHLEMLGGAEASCAVLFAGEGGEDAFSDPLEWPPKKGRPGSPRGLPRAIVLRREAQAEPGWSILQIYRLLSGALRTVRDWVLGTRESS
jgi:hypothetical protein